MKRRRRTASGVVIAVVAAAVLPPYGAAASPTEHPPELWVMSSDGTNQRRLAPFADRSSASSWSPDGSRLAFATYEGINVVDASGQSAPELVGPGWSPSWSPDATAIAYIRPGSTRPALAVMAPDGSNERVVATDVDTYDLLWSPDGRRIAFTRCGDHAHARCNLTVVGADGTGERALAVATSSHASWSPDGSSLVYAGGFNHLSVVDVASGRTTDLVAEPGGGHSPDWGPAGRIAYARWEEGTGTSIWIVDEDGTDPLSVHVGTDPQWSPDGSRIAFVTPDGIRVMVVGTGGAPVLTPGDDDHYAPAWSPDGESIAYFTQKPFPPQWPEYDRSVSVAASDRFIRARVRSEPGGRGCLRGVPIRLQRRAEGVWRTEERARTDSEGRVRWSVSGRKGVYRVRAPQRYVGFPGDSPVCLKATSPRFRLRG